MLLIININLLVTVQISIYPEMESITKSKPKRSKKGKSKISFDEELITKEDAKELVSKQKDILLQQEKEDSEKPKKKRKRNKDNPNESINKSENNESSKSKKKKTKKDVDSQTPMDTEDNNNPEEETPEITNKDKKEKKESNRSIKKKKHAKLLEDKKVQIELDLQQKALNYLSKWKHSRSEWKFEKLRQIWLQQNLFDSSKIPEEFWDTVVQYFNGAQGKSRQTVLDEALKFIENSSEENTDEDYQIKLKRSRDVVQNLE